MFAFAPLIAFTDWLTTDDDWRLIRRRTPSPLGLAALEVAKRELGNGEEGGNNLGPHIKRWGGKQGQSWCAVLVSYCLETASLGRGRPYPVKRSHGARRLFRRCVAAGWLVEYSDVQPGDVVCWARGRDGGWQAHIGIVETVHRDKDGTLIHWDYIAGNEGVRAVVASHSGHVKRLIGFARLP